MTPARVCAGVAFVLLVILIIVTRDIPIATIETTAASTTTTTAAAAATTNNRPAVYFVATRDSNETNKASNDITFDNIPVNVGGGMFPNGWFIAPVSGVYW